MNDVYKMILYKNNLHKISGLLAWQWLILFDLIDVWEKGCKVVFYARNPKLKLRWEFFANFVLHRLRVCSMWHLHVFAATRAGMTKTISNTRAPWNWLSFNYSWPNWYGDVFHPLKLFHLFEITTLFETSWL